MGAPPVDKNEIPSLSTASAAMHPSGEVAEVTPESPSRSIFNKRPASEALGQIADGAQKKQHSSDAMTLLGFVKQVEVDAVDNAPPNDGGAVKQDGGP